MFLQNIQEPLTLGENLFRVLGVNLTPGASSYHTEVTGATLGLFRGILELKQPNIYISVGLLRNKIAMATNFSIILNNWKTLENIFVEG